MFMYATFFDKLSENLLDLENLKTRSRICNPTKVPAFIYMSWLKCWIAAMETFQILLVIPAK